MNPKAKKGAVATAGVIVACAACCAVPVAAAGGVAVVAGPVGILAVLLVAIGGLWAWLLRRGNRQQT